jgi:hypothetical protein
MTEPGVRRLPAPGCAAIARAHCTLQTRSGPVLPCRLSRHTTGFFNPSVSGFAIELLNGLDQDLPCAGQSLDQMSSDDRHIWIVLIPASTPYLNPQKSSCADEFQTAAASSCRSQTTVRRRRRKRCRWPQLFRMRRDLRRLWEEVPCEILVARDRSSP